MVGSSGLWLLRGLGDTPATPLWAASAVLSICSLSWQVGERPSPNPLPSGKGAFSLRWSIKIICEADDFD